MSGAWSDRQDLPGTPIVAWWTTRSDGDQRALGTVAAGSPAGSPRGLAGLPSVPVLTARQVHGDVVLVEETLVRGAVGLLRTCGVRWSVLPRDGAVVHERTTGDSGQRSEPPVSGTEPGPGRQPSVTGDALVARGPGVAVAVRTADCAPVALGTADGVFAAVHVGWRGLVAGVLPAAIAVVQAVSCSPVVAALGPTIGPCCYEFGDEALDEVVARVGGIGRATTVAGRPALDLPAAVHAVATAAGARMVDRPVPCTACSGRYHSHRGRRDVGRQAVVVWCDDAGAGR